MSSSSVEVVVIDLVSEICALRNTVKHAARQILKLRKVKYYRENAQKINEKRRQKRKILREVERRNGVAQTSSAPPEVHQTRSDISDNSTAITTADTTTTIIRAGSEK